MTVKPGIMNLTGMKGRDVRRVARRPIGERRNLEAQPILLAVFLWATSWGMTARKEARLTVIKHLTSPAS